jgi:SAM-dependent methyltransferase
VEIVSATFRKEEFWKYNWIIKHKIVRALERAAGHARGALLDLGCGSKPFAPVLEGRVHPYLGVDLPDSIDLGPAAAGPDAFARGEALPFRDGAFDTVLGLSMLTYVPEPARVLAEAARVLRPGGVLIMEFTQMAPHHRVYDDYQRFTRTGAVWLLERAGFEIIEAIGVGGLMTRVGMSAIEPLNRINRGPLRILTELPVRFLYVVLQLGFELLDLGPHSREAVAHLVVARKR